MEILDQVSLSRRQLLVGTSVAAAAGIVDGAATSTMAKAPILNTQAPPFYRFKLGSIEATVVSDGPLSIGDPVKTFRGPAPQEIGEMMTDHFLPADNVVLDQNALVINTGDKLARVRDRNELGEAQRRDGPAGAEPQASGHRSQGHRRCHPHPCPHRSHRRHHGGGRQPQLPERADLHFAG